MTKNNDKEPKIKIVVAPGAFDNFDGTQEELDNLIAEITAMAEDGTLMENSEPLQIDDPDADDFMVAMADIFGELGVESVTWEEDMANATEERKKKLN